MPRQPRPKRFDSQHHAIPDKANRILNVILIAFILVIIRIWHLAVVQYESRLEESRKPQRKTIVEPATRATIRDRFNIPLAVNKIHYQAAVLYSHLREIPSIAWEKDADGKRVRKWRRKEYIKQLSQLLAEELGLDAERIEDLIHAKASYYAQVPFVIKEDITEKEYYRLKMLEREWPGIYVRRLPQRCYPKERTAADVIGYMGAINRQEYEAILQEMRQLENGIVQFESGEEPEWPKGVANYAEARRRVKDLEEKAYSVHDYVGKAGIEAVFEQQLRGFYGKRSFYSDSRGNFLRELPGSRPPLSGYRILLTISAELQEYAEKLLAQNESIRLVRKCSLGTAKQTLVTLKHPWIKGGAIVVMDPQTGEVLTLASYPRFDPNDFIASGRPDLNREKKHHINRWFENEAHLAAIWDRQQPLERERYDDRQQAFYDEQRWLTWDHYLDFILPSDGALRKLFYQVTQLGQVYEVQQLADRALTLCAPANLYAVFNALYNGDIHIPYPVKMTGEEKQWLEKTLNSHGDELRLIRDRLSLYFDNLPQNYDKVLFVDICRLILDTGRISEDLIEEMQGQSINTYQEACGALVSVMSVVKEMSKGLYHDLDFKEWRASSEKEFLKQKRQQEKISKTYPKPYLDYLDQQENQMFQAFWEESKWKLLTAFLTGYLA
jgi:cell division protein FtsI/penicillin-binding protein 2